MEKITNQVILDMVQESIRNGHLSKLEFILIPEDLQEEYINHTLSYSSWFPDWAFKYAPDRLKPIILDYQITNGRGLSKEELEACTKEQIEKYVDRLIKQESYVNSFEIEYFTEEQKIKYLNQKAIHGDYMEPELFMMLDEYHKLRYILMTGLNEVSSEIYEWFLVYEKATNRDNKINQILE